MRTSTSKSKKTFEKLNEKGTDSYIFLWGEDDSNHKKTDNFHINRFRKCRWTVFLFPAQCEHLRPLKPVLGNRSNLMIKIPFLRSTSQRFHLWKCIKNSIPICRTIEKWQHHHRCGEFYKCSLWYFSSLLPRFLSWWKISRQKPHVWDFICSNTPYFDVYHLHRVMVNYRLENIRSRILLKRLSFDKEGYARDYLMILGKWRDHILASRIHDLIRD